MNKIMGIKAISFDGDETLWDFEKVMRHPLNHVLEEPKKVDHHVADILNFARHWRGWRYERRLAYRNGGAFIALGD